MAYYYGIYKDSLKYQKDILIYKFEQIEEKEIETANKDKSIFCQHFPSSFLAFSIYKISR